VKPYRIQWQNTHQYSRPWVDFCPDMKIIASSEGSAIGTAEGKLREKDCRDPVRAVEITWAEFA